VLFGKLLEMRNKNGKRLILEREPLYGDILKVGTDKGHFAFMLAKEGYIKL